MLHGGIRYLENAEFRLVREALHERNRMLKNAPHYAKPLADLYANLSLVFRHVERTAQIRRLDGSPGRTRRFDYQGGVDDV